MWAMFEIWLHQHIAGNLQHTKHVPTFYVEKEGEIIRLSSLSLVIYSTPLFLALR